MEIAAANDARLGEEVTLLNRHGIKAVVTDVAPFPLRAARDAGIPGCAVANFTWHDIYREYAETPQDQALLEGMVDEYRAATTAFLTPLATPTVAGVFADTEQVPLVARRAKNIRDTLAGSARPGDRLALVYLGVWGVDVDWEALGRTDGWTFLTYESPLNCPQNVVVVDRRDYPCAVRRPQWTQSSSRPAMVLSPSASPTACR